MKQIIKLATPFERVLNALKEIKNDFLKYNVQLEFLSENEVIEKYQISSNDALKANLIDANISNNFHTMQSYNSINSNETPLVMVNPLFHPKYGLYIHKNNSLGIKTLKDVKKYTKLRLLFAPFNELYIAPCDLSRSLFLLKKLGLVEIDEKRIQEKGFNLNLKDIKNIYDFEFIKTSHLLEIPKKFQDQQKYDLAINCPGMMRDPNFIRIGSIGQGEKENIEPKEDVLLSYAVILAAKKGTEKNEKITILKKVLNSFNYKTVQFKYGGITQDYIMVEDQKSLKERIETNYEQI
ncbi:ABC-type transport system, substrate-binding protein [Candidatus Phytoplasma solani]|uniref:metal ABC transporter substrate-binding protein n=1 Tax=Candidatus Phytoplasma solani TaxID=69896 RepID=UPI0032DAC019